MSFRLKTIVGVALIEGSLLLFLVWSSLTYLAESNEKELTLRALDNAESIANLTRDAVLAADLARLDSVVQHKLESPEIVYLRIMDSERLLAAGGHADALARPFAADERIDDVADGVYDVGVDITEQGAIYGRVELGVSVGRVQQLITDARRHLSGIAIAEMVLVALFSYLLGTYLTRGLASLARASRAISGGALGTCVDVSGDDELAQTGRTFNAMSLRLAESQREMERSIEQGLTLSRRLAEKEQRLSTILDTAVDGFVTIDRHGIIDDINVAGAALFGYEVGELVGRNVSCLMPEPDRSRHDDYLARYLDTGEARVIGRGRRVEGLRKDGSRFPMDLAVSEMVVGERRMFVGLVRDLSGQMQAEAAARRSEAMRAAIVDANLDALVTVDAGDRIVEFSGVAEQVFGYSREEVMGKRMADHLIPPEMREMHLRGMRHYLATGEGPVIGNRIEVQAMRADGALFPAELTVQVIDVDGDKYFTAMIRDITDRKAEEKALLDAKRTAEVASEAKSRFLAHMSHEIRSPLNAVLGALNLLLDDGLNTEQRLYARTAETSGRILLGLINDILDFSKIEAGELRLDAQPFELTALLSDVADVIALRAEDRGLPTALAAQPHVDHALIGDVVRLRQILVNLMDNALKFTDEGAVALTVRTVEEDQQSLRLCFRIEDTGVGIPEAEQARLFDEFQQIDSSDSTRHGGTGLGLPISEGLCRAMGGSIRLESEPGRGSRFEVEIPFSKGEKLAAATRVGPALRDRRVLTPDVITVGLHPLLVQALNLHNLTRERFVTVVDSAAAAIGRLTENTKAILVDAALPESELALLARHARDKGVAHRILVSVKLTPAERDWVRSGDYNDVLRMPLLLCRLVELLRRGPGNAPAAGDPRPPTPDEHQERPGGAVPAGAILLAEDSPANQLVATAMLEKAGYRVDTVADGHQAVEAFARGGHQLILMDVRMPEMNGLEATATIRAMPGGETIPIIAMTANALRGDADRCLAAGMDDFVPKPVDRGLLLDTIARHLPALPDTAAQGVHASSAEEDLASEPLIDEAVIRQLGEDVTEEAVPAMIQMFIREATMRAENVLKALEGASMDLLEDETHTLKSCAGTFGAVRLQALARDIETACREGNREAADNLGRRVEGLLQQTLASYRNRFDFLAEQKGED